MVFTKKAAAVVIGLALLPMIAVETVFINTNFVFAKPTKASEYQTVLNSANAPTISSGSAVVTDTKGVTWEYSGAANKANYHISLNHQGFFGVKSNTAYGYTAIESISVNFVGQAKSELWLLTSTDGITWHEQEILTSGQATTKANNWRFIRFYHYDYCDQGDTPGSADIESVYIDYGCVGGISATEDVDNALDGNVVATTGLDHTSTTSEISPNSVGGQAVKFTKQQGASKTNLTIGFNRGYTLGETAYSKIEFDIWTSFYNYAKEIEVLNTDGSYTSSKISTANTDSYVWTSLGNNWYHAELPITVIVSLISGYNGKDIPSKGIEKKVFNAIRINAGAVVIDNLRIGSSQCNPGTYNSTSYQPSVGEIYWLKTSWVGKLYNKDVYMEFRVQDGDNWILDSTVARQIPITDGNLNKESPFYLEWLTPSATKTIKITVYVVCGYNHRTQSASKIVTMK